MTKLHFRAALLAASSLFVLATPAQEADAAAAEASAEARAMSDDQSSTANQAGQANDKQSLTSSDIIVTGSRMAEQAPVTASLTTTQPQAAVSRDFIARANPTADFNTLIAITPGVSISGTSNGQGFGETKAVIRGFQDGEYNVTYDSIPFADTNNPTHHSTAFFPSTTIETVVVDRGPGNASQLGQASYGGNINMYSRAARDERSATVEGIVGNWNTFIGRVELQSGEMKNLGGAKLVVTGQYLQSDGALTYSPVNSKNLYAKLVLPLGPSNTLTLMSTWNRNFYYQSDVLGRQLRRLYRAQPRAGRVHPPRRELRADLQHRPIRSELRHVQRPDPGGLLPLQPHRQDHRFLVHAPAERVRLRVLDGQSGLHVRLHQQYPLG